MSLRPEIYAELSAWENYWTDPLRGQRWNPTGLPSTGSEGGDLSVALESVRLPASEARWREELEKVADNEKATNAILQRFREHKKRHSISPSQKHRFRKDTKDWREAVATNPRSTDEVARLFDIEVADVHKARLLYAEEQGQDQATGRTCEGCGAPISLRERPDKRYCTSTCKRRVQRERQNAAA